MGQKNIKKKGEPPNGALENQPPASTKNVATSPSPTSTPKSDNPKTLKKRNTTASISPNGPKRSSSMKRLKRTLSSKISFNEKKHGGVHNPNQSSLAGTSKATTSPVVTATLESSSTNEEINNDLVDDLCSKKKVSAEDFEPIYVIGRGSFGKVMQVKHKENGKIYAMKVMNKDMIIAKNQVNHTKDENNILQKIKHPFIVNLNFAFQTPTKLYLVLDYVNGGELFSHLKKKGKFSEDRTRFYVAEIASALFHLHKNGIIYRDLKPENLLLNNEGHIVITDFGLSKQIMNDTTHTFCGTPEYLAPEILRGEGHSYPVDLWSLGILAFEMMTGLPPFYSQDVTEMYHNIVTAEIYYPEELSDEAVGLIHGLLQKEPEDRLVEKEIKSHPFFDGLDWDKLYKKEIPPPWKPPVKGLNDIGQIDETFLREDISEQSSEDSQSTHKDIFDGFTFDKKGILEQVVEESEGN